MTDDGIALCDLPDQLFDQDQWLRLQILCQDSKQRAFVTLKRWCMLDSPIPPEVQSPRYHRTQRDNDFRESIELGRRLVSATRNTMMAGDLESTATMPGLSSAPLSPRIWKMASIDFEASCIRLGATEYHDVYIYRKKVRAPTAEERCEELLQKAKAERPRTYKKTLRHEVSSICPAITDDEFNVIYKRVYQTKLGRRRINGI